ncbi:unknown [Cercopithecine alphaherpesvirus 9]|uniref:Uncharacterized protein n=1 Tax=Cercopithecine herpesvirus 9 (strain DHV) TaxID=36348 RepID=Q9E1Z2_CHV9D|nr:nuclear egress membrane protein [Cercopithecine alphaherpesvirus 9]AAG27197.1 unknown [Cercopithecine alphaherpesvirus 9]
MEKTTYRKLSPVEYVMRLMANWAECVCDPYIKIQNTGVSVLFQGYFFRPTNAPVAAISIDSNNVILSSTLSTGLSLSALEAIKRGGGIDKRPLQAMMWINCFVRMPYVQLAFRFMGPEDPTRTHRLLTRATDACVYKKTHGMSDDNRVKWRKLSNKSMCKNYVSNAKTCEPVSSLMEEKGTVGKIPFPPPYSFYAAIIIASISAVTLGAVLCFR